MILATTALLPFSKGLAWRACQTATCEYGGRCFQKKQNMLLHSFPSWILQSAWYLSNRISAGLIELRIKAKSPATISTDSHFRRLRLRGSALLNRSWWISGSPNIFERFERAQCTHGNSGSGLGKPFVMLLPFRTVHRAVYTREYLDHLPLIPEFAQLWRHQAQVNLSAFALCHALPFCGTFGCQNCSSICSICLLILIACCMMATSRCAWA